jgi:hypothetical protein
MNKIIPLVLISSVFCPGLMSIAQATPVLRTIHELTTLMPPKANYSGGTITSGADLGQACNVQILNDEQGYAMNISLASNNFLLADISISPKNGQGWKSAFAAGSPTANSVSVVVTQKYSDENNQDSKAVVTITKSGESFTVYQDDGDGSAPSTCQGLK